MLAVARARPSEPVLSPDDDGEIPEPIRQKLADTMSKSDRVLLEYVARVGRVELDDRIQFVDPKAPSVDGWTLFFFECHGLLASEVDPANRLYILSTPALTSFLNPPAKRRRRG